MPTIFPDSHNQIMQRVRTVHWIRAWLASPAAGFVGALALIFAMGTMVSLESVIANTMDHSDMGTDISYLVSSLLHTRTIVQIMSALIVLVAGAVFVNAFRTVRRYGFTPGAISKLLIP